MEPASPRTHVPESVADDVQVHADLEIEFAGQTAHSQDLVFQFSTQGNEKRLTGTIPAMLNDFKIDPPSLLTMPMKNEIPVKVDVTWKQQ